MFVLGSWGRFVVLATGGFVVIIAVIVVSCFVGPGCWGFEYLQREEKKKKKIAVERVQVEAGTEHCNAGLHWLDNNDYVIYQTVTKGIDEKPVKIEDPLWYYPKERVFNLKCAPLLVAPSLYSNIKEAAPKLELRLTYRDSEQEDLPGRLTIHVMEVTSLRCREYQATLDPYLLLEVLNNKWSLQKTERVVQMVKTEVAKNSTNPIFDQSFSFDVKNMELKNWCLKLTVIDDDHLTKPTPLFEKRVHLRDIKNLRSDTHVPLVLDMQEVNLNIGSLLFGITYLPTAQRLNINIVKAGKLRYQNAVTSLPDFRPYVRVIMVNNHGKCLKKKKTKLSDSEENPTFNQSLVFDLSISNLEQTVFLVLLCTKNPQQGSSSDDSSMEGDIETYMRRSKDKVLGSVALGRNVRCNRARDHWVTVMQNPRKMVTVWHDLK